MKVKQMVINNVIPEQVDCHFCQARREEQNKYIGQIREKFSDLRITVFPLQPHEVRGIDTLKNIGSMLFEGVFSNGTIMPTNRHKGG
jgi:arsenite-transporting ATPase